MVITWRRRALCWRFRFLGRHSDGVLSKRPFVDASFGPGTRAPRDRTGLGSVTPRGGRLEGLVAAGYRRVRSLRRSTFRPCHRFGGHRQPPEWTIRARTPMGARRTSATRKCTRAWSFGRFQAGEGRTQARFRPCLFAAGPGRARRAHAFTGLRAIAVSGQAAVAPPAHPVAARAAPMGGGGGGGGGVCPISPRGAGTTRQWLRNGSLLPRRSNRRPHSRFPIS